MLSADRFCVVNHRNEVMEAEGTPCEGQFELELECEWHADSNKGDQPRVHRDLTEQEEEAPDAQEPDRSQFIRGGRLGVLLVHGLGGTPTELRFVAARPGPRRPHRLLLPARRPLRHARGASPLDLAAMVRQRRGGPRPAQGALRHHRCRRSVDGRHPGHAPGAEPARGCARPAAVRADAQARRLVDALVLAGAATTSGRCRSGSSSTSPSTSPTA